MSLIDTITDEIKKAMLAKDKVRLEALRAIKKELLEAKTAKGAGDELTEAVTTALLQKMVKQRRDSAEIYTAQKREDLAGPEIAQMEVIREFLPAQLSPIELEAAVKRIGIFPERDGKSDGDCVQTTCRQGRRKRYLRNGKTFAGITGKRFIQGISFSCYRVYRPFSTVYPVYWFFVLYSLISVTLYLCFYRS